MQLGLSCVPSVVGVRSSTLTVSIDNNAAQQNFTVLCTGIQSVSVFPREEPLDFGGIILGPNGQALQLLWVSNVSPFTLSLNLTVSFNGSNTRKRHRVQVEESSSSSSSVTTSVSSSTSSVTIDPSIVILPARSTQQVSIAVFPTSLGSGQATVMASSAALQHAVLFRDLTWEGLGGVMVIETPSITFSTSQWEATAARR